MGQTLLAIVCDVGCILSIENKESYIEAIYPPYNSSRRYATAGVYFTNTGIHTEYHIWVNSTYSQQLYGLEILEKNPLFLTIQNNIESAINSKIDPNIKSIAISIRNNPFLKTVEYTE